MALPVGAGLDKLAIAAGLDQNRGRPAVDKLLMRRNSGSGLRELDLINWPSGLALIKSVAGRLLINCLCGAIAGRASES